MRLALPKGSLNEPGRASTEEMLQGAGYTVTGYSLGSRNYRPKIDGFDCFVDRPQNMPRKIIAGLYDAGILGKDIAEEWKLAGFPLDCYGLLGYGKVKIVAASDKPLEQILSSHEILCETEYPYLAREWLGRVTGKMPSIESKFGRIPGDNGYVIMESLGATEVSISQGADLIVETIQSGRTLKENGLSVIAELLSSEAGLYARPGYFSTELSGLAEKLQKAT